MDYKNILKFVEFCKVRVSGTEFQREMNLAENKQLIVRTEDMKSLMADYSRAAFHQVIRFLVFSGLFVKTMKGYYVIYPGHEFLTAKDEFEFAGIFKGYHERFAAQFKKEEEKEEDEDGIETTM